VWIAYDPIDGLRHVEIRLHKSSAFQKALKNLLGMKPKPHSEMKLGKAKGKKAMSPAKKRASPKPKNA
jgi:hypothetical protein